MTSAQEVFFEVATMVDGIAPWPFAVVRVDTSKRLDSGVEGRVVSFHPTRSEAEAEARKLAETTDLLASLKRATVALIAMTSLVIKAEDAKTQPSKQMGSDAMFCQMLADFDATTVSARNAIVRAEVRLAALPREGEQG